MPVFLLLVILFVAWFTYERKKSSSASEKSSKKFWELEHEAAFSRKKSTDDVAFITFPPELIPDHGGDDGLKAVTDRLSALASCELADLSGLTNTEIKLRWGVASFDRLAGADTSFGELAIAIADCCENLVRLGRGSERLPLLEFAYGSGMRLSRIILPYAEMLAELGDSKKLEEVVYAALDDPSCPQSLADSLRILFNNTMNP